MRYLTPTLAVAKARVAPREGGYGEGRGRAGGKRGAVKE